MKGEKLMDKKALSPKDAITVYPALGGLGHLANLRSHKRGPRYFKTGKKVVYRPEDIEAFLFKNPVLTVDSMNMTSDSGKKIRCE